MVSTEDPAEKVPMSLKATGLEEQQSPHLSIQCLHVTPGVPMAPYPAQCPQLRVLSPKMPSGTLTWSPGWIWLI